MKKLSGNRIKYRVLDNNELHRVYKKAKWQKIPEPKEGNNADN
jgi:hypothetical protein